MSVYTTELKQIPVEGGDVYHFIKSSSPGYKGFGEVYISFINKGCKKDWKLHKKMTLNLIVPIGEVNFKFQNFDKNEDIIEITISPKNYKRITVEPNTWFCFENKGKSDAMVINFADIPHEEGEVVRRLNK